MKAAIFLLFTLLVVISARKIRRPTKIGEFNRLKPELVQGATTTDFQLGDVWKNCTSKDSPMDITRVTITPAQIKSGQSINVLVNYTLRTTIEGGSMNIDINLAGEQQNLSLDLCDALNYVQLNCPLPQTTSGFFNVTTTIPFDAPEGQYTGKVTATNKANVEFMCIMLDFMMG